MLLLCVCLSLAFLGTVLSLFHGCYLQTIVLLYAHVHVLYLSVTCLADLFPRGVGNNVSFLAPAWERSNESQVPFASVVYSPNSFIECLCLFFFAHCITVCHKLEQKLAR